MANVFDIAEKLRNGEKVIIHNRYRFIVMQQMSEHNIGDIRVDFKQHNRNHVVMTIAR